MADKSHWITFIAEYEGGSKVPFQIDPWTLERGDHVAHTVAREKQEEGFLKPGEIAMVYNEKEFHSAA
jgi:hypothetical protein